MAELDEISRVQSHFPPHFPKAKPRETLRLRGKFVISPKYSKIEKTAKYLFAIRQHVFLQSENTFELVGITKHIGKMIRYIEKYSTSSGQTS